MLLAFIGPTIPTNLMATESGVARLNISWSSLCLDRTDIRFSLTVLNLNSSRHMPNVVSEIQDPHYRFEITDNTSCDVYRFHVIAMYSSISSNSSDSITSSFPSLPDIFPVENSLQHSLVKSAEGVTLSFSFNVSYVIKVLYTGYSYLKHRIARYKSIIYSVYMYGAFFAEHCNTC